MNPADNRQCAKCDYDLTGLPQEHICPECGFYYDVYSTSIRLKARRENWIALIMGLTYFCYFVGLRQRGPLRMPGWFLVLFSIVFVGMFLFRLRKSQTVADRMIFTRAGFVLYSTISTSIPVPWSVIKSASCSWVDGALCILRTDDQGPMKISHRLLGGVRIAKRCAAEINRLKGIYSANTMVADHDSER